MGEIDKPGSDFTGSKLTTSQEGKQRHRGRAAVLAGVGLVALVSTAALWLGLKASTVKQELEAAIQLVGPLKGYIAEEEAAEISTTVNQMRLHTMAAKEAADDPVWTLASSLPWIGVNFSAAGEIAQSADDVVNLGLIPLTEVYESLNWDNLLPSPGGSDLMPLQAASPKLASAAHAVQASAERLEQIDELRILAEIAGPLSDGRAQLRDATGALTAAADVSRVAPSMLGTDTPRNYLLIIQNNAEARASGGIPGALAVLTVEDGKLSLSAQSSAGEVGAMSQTVPVDREQQQIYSGRLGKFMQDVNLTPDFPSAAATARAMWEKKTGQDVDGVISMDPIALGYLLDVTGPVNLTDPELTSLSGTSLPLQLTGENVVQVLLSDVYAKIPRTELQDAYFAGVAREVFGALSEGRGGAKALLESIVRGAQDNRVLLWSTIPQEQSILEHYKISGSIDGPSTSPAAFGVYFNDGTGAKMDYYVKRSVRIIKECPRGGYEQMTVRITSMNTAPADAATSLPPYVTGAGIFGVPPGSVQTNIVVYGPVQANVETAKVDGRKTEFAPYLHSNRPLGITAIRLAPGESKTVDFTFGKIVQHIEPTLTVTPTVQTVKDVTLPTENATCG